jgi:hypothetical protein
MKYINEEDLKKEILESKKIGKETEKLKVMFVLIIDHMLEKGNFRNYDEETKDIMRVKAYEFLANYWNNYVEKKVIVYLKKDRKEVKKILKNINPKKIRTVKDKNGETLVKIGLSETEYKNVENILKTENIEYEKETTVPSAFAYLTQIVKNAFIQVIKKSNFNYIVKTDNNNGVNIVKQNEKDEMKEYFKTGESASKEIIDLYYEKNGYLEKGNKKVIEVYEKYLKNKKECNFEKQENCIKIETICDIHPAIRTIILESETFEEFMSLLNHFYDEKEIKLKDIMSNPTVFYLLKKLSEN